jgi:hypothetical protein
MLYADMPDVAVFGPGAALVRINAITSIDRPTNMTADGLRNSLSAWAGANPGALPPLNDQPWQLGVRIALTTSDAAVRSDALQAVQDKRELAALEPLVGALGQGNTLTGQARKDVGDLVGALSTVAFPVPSTEDADAAEQVRSWRRAWLAYLQEPGGKDEKHIQYSWQQLEAALRSYKDAPSDAEAEDVKYFRAALLSQFDGAGQIPASASPAVKKLLEAPLAAKQEIAKAVAVVEQATGNADETYEMSRQLRIIQQELEDDVAVEVGRMYAERLAAVAYSERNARTCGTIGQILSRVSGVPVELNFADIDARRQRLQRWADEYNNRFSPRIALPEGG